MDQPWYALQVKPRYEALVANGLTLKGFEVFLPAGRRQPSSRSAQPLFPSYLFCRLDILNRLPVLITPGVVKILGVGKRAIAVEPEEIEAIRRVVASGLPTTPWPGLEAGQTVRVSCGPLAGIHGVVRESKDVHRLIIGVSLLSRSVAVEVSRSWLEPVREGWPAGSADYAARSAATGAERSSS